MSKKQNFKKIQILTPHEEIPIFPDFPNFEPKFPDREFKMVLCIIYFLKAYYHSFP